jgi:hypothetical protein
MVKGLIGWPPRRGRRTQFFVFFVSLVYTTTIVRISDFWEEADWELKIENL